jgi:hypothetical protein
MSGLHLARTLSSTLTRKGTPMNPVRRDRSLPWRGDLLLRHQAQHVIALTAALWGLDPRVDACPPRVPAASRRPDRVAERALAAWR